MKTFKLTFPDPDATKRAVHELLDASQWFAVTPLPEDKYDIEVKVENTVFLRCQHPDKNVLPLPHPVIPDTGGVMWDAGLRLFVIPCKLTGFTCLGIDRAIRQTNAVAHWMSMPQLALDEALANPTSDEWLHLVWHQYKKVMYAGERVAAAQGSKCPVALTPEFIGHEGQWVRVTEEDGEVREFKIGRSTGWMPCHLEIESGEDGGPAACLSKGATLEFFGTRRPRKQKK